MTEQWEYLRASDDSNLAQLGREGWELVGVLPANEKTPALFYFKRPVITESFRDRVTLEQKERYFATLGVKVGQKTEAEELS